MKNCLLIFLLLAITTKLPGATFKERVGVQWSSTLEWTIENPSFENNPFDLKATVTYEHEKTGHQIKTEMFYTGEDRWSFRFCGTIPGRWKWTSSSQDADLDQHMGSIWIEPNDHDYGFVVGHGNKWARQKGRSGSPSAFIPQYVMYRHPAGIAKHFDRIDHDIDTFIHEHGFTGFHVPVYCRWFDLNNERSNAIDVSDPSPDFKTFEVLEQFIQKLHGKGGVVHFWAWGDESRRQTPVKWSINGKVDQRLQRYIAARLGPLPGWTMGYGFDLDEWVNEHQLKAWHEFMDAHMGWPHLLGGRHGDPNHGTNHSSAISWNKVLDYSSYEHHRPTPEVYEAAINALPNKPVFSEDRFRIRQSKQYRQKDYNEEMTRRGLWHSAMAGGVANIWGRLEGDMAINMGFGASEHYTHPEWIKTYSIFFEKFFANDATPQSKDQGLHLLSSSKKRWMSYFEDTETIQLSVPVFFKFNRSIAVDTKKHYIELEITLKQSTSGSLVWNAPYQSDWVIVLQDLSQPYPKSEIFEGLELDWSTHQRSAFGSDNFQLTWAKDDHLYGAWGDGGGFGGTNSRGRVGLGVARIKGTADEYLGTNLWGGHQGQNPASFDGKSWGMISLRDKLHMWVVPDKPVGKTYRNHYEYIELASSSDNGASWTKAPWRFETKDHLTIPTFLNFGKNNGGVPHAFGGYVYTYFIAPQTPTIEQMGPNGMQLIVHQPGRIYLARIRSNNLDKGTKNFEFYTGVDSDNTPRWGSVQNKKPVFEDANGVGWCVSASYHSEFQRVLLATQHSQNAKGRIGIFDAPTPWGPWTTVEYFDRDNPFGATRPGSLLPWKHNVFFVSFVTKWFDGDQFTLAFTGAGRGHDNDSFNTVQGRFLPKH